MKGEIMKMYRAAVIGCSRMGGFIDHEVIGSPTIVLPYSHAAGFYASERTNLIACSDLREDVMEEFGKLYDVPKERQYTDYREMIEKEQPDIVSVATQPEQRAEIVIFAAENGVKAIYAEKAMAASMAETDAMVEAVERNGVAFNLGTNRRWHTGFDKMKEIIDSGELGRLRTLIIYSNGTLFNTASHNFDLILRLNSDCQASWVMAHLPGAGSVNVGDEVREEGIWRFLDICVEDNSVVVGNEFREDPVGHGIIQFENGVTTYALLSPRRSEWEAICDKGTLTAFNNGLEWQLRRQVAIDPQGRMGLKTDVFPEFERASTTANLIQDLVNALDTGNPPRGGVRTARANTELIFAFMESHLRGGARVNLPLKDCKLRLMRNRPPRQPKFNP